LLGFTLIKTNSLGWRYHCTLMVDVITHCHEEF